MTDQPLDPAKLAMALQWAANHMMPPSQRVAVLPRQRLAADLGQEVASNFLLPLTVELALKGLIQRHQGPSAYPHKHDLLLLYETQPCEVRRSLDERFTHMATDTSAAGLDLPAFLEQHRNDFERWRYLNGDVAGLTADPIAFQLAACAVLDIAFGDTHS